MLHQKPNFKVKPFRGIFFKENVLLKAFLVLHLLLFMDYLPLNSHWHLLLVSFSRGQTFLDEFLCHILLDRCCSHFLPDRFVYNLSSTHASQHSHLCYTDLLILLALHCPTFMDAEHNYLICFDTHAAALLAMFDLTAIC